MNKIRYSSYSYRNIYYTVCITYRCFDARYHINSQAVARTKHLRCENLFTNPKIRNPAL